MFPVLCFELPSPLSQTTVPSYRDALLSGTEGRLTDGRMRECMSPLDYLCIIFGIVGLSSSFKDLIYTCKTLLAVGNSMRSSIRLKCFNDNFDDRGSMDGSINWSDIVNVQVDLTKYPNLQSVDVHFTTSCSKYVLMTPLVIPPSVQHISFPRCESTYQLGAYFPDLRFIKKLWIHVDSLNDIYDRVPSLESLSLKYGQTPLNAGLLYEQIGVLNLRSLTVRPVSSSFSSYMKITDLPLSRYTGLEELDVDVEGIGCIPGNLRRLRKLCIYRDLRFLGDITNLLSLECLSIHNLRTDTTLPHDFRLLNLKELSMDDGYERTVALRNLCNINLVRMVKLELNLDVKDLPELPIVPPSVERTPPKGAIVRGTPTLEYLRLSISNMDTMTHSFCAFWWDVREVFLGESPCIIWNLQNKSIRIQYTDLSTIGDHVIPNTAESMILYNVTCSRPRYRLDCKGLRRASMQLNDCGLESLCNLDVAIRDVDVFEVTNVSRSSMHDDLFRIREFVRKLKAQRPDSRYQIVKYGYSYVRVSPE
jgi:hypothetical protein